MLINNTAIALSTTFFVASLLLSGCTHTAPLLQVSKELRSDLNITTLTTVITNTATQQNWQVFDQTSTSLTLKKSYQKSRMLTTTHERWKKVTIDTDVYINVDFSQKVLKIVPTKQSVEALTSNCDRELFNEDIKTLEQAIDMKVSEKVL